MRVVLYPAVGRRLSLLDVCALQGIQNELWTREHVLCCIPLWVGG